MECHLLLIRHLHLVPGCPSSFQDDECAPIDDIQGTDQLISTTLLPSCKGDSVADEGFVARLHRWQVVNVPQIRGIFFCHAAVGRPSSLACVASVTRRQSLLQLPLAAVLRCKGYDVDQDPTLENEALISDVHPLTASAYFPPNLMCRLLYVLS